MSDLIRRSDAIRALNREKSDWNCDYNVPIDNCIKRLNKVKSADRPQGELIMAKDLHRYGILIHRKGTKYEDDFWFTDNRRFQIREFSHDAAEAVLPILKHQWGDNYSFRIRRID